MPRRPSRPSSSRSLRSAAGRPLIGVDIGGTGIKAAVLTPRGKVLGRGDRDTGAAEGVDRILARVEEAVVEACWEAGVPRAKLRSIGVGVPGAVDRRRGAVRSAVNLGWTDFPLARLLGEKLKIDVVLENDVTAAVWGEHQVGAARGETDLLGVWVGTGIGGGLVLGGALFTGKHSSAGEIGRGVVLPWAPPGQGSLEQVCSRTGIVETLTRLLRSGRQSAVSPMVKGDLSKIDNKVLAAAWKRGDPLVTEVIEHAAAVLGTHIGGVVTLLSLGRVVLGGGVTQALGKPWTDAVRRAVKRTVFPDTLQGVEVVASELGQDAGAVGAALLAGGPPPPPPRASGAA